MSTGEDGGHIGTRYSYYNVKRNVQVCGTSMSSLGVRGREGGTVVAKVTKTFPMLDALTKAHVLFFKVQTMENRCCRPGTQCC